MYHTSDVYASALTDLLWRNNRERMVRCGRPAQDALFHPFSLLREAEILPAFTFTCGEYSLHLP